MGGVCSKCVFILCKMGIDSVFFVFFWFVANFDGLRACQLLRVGFGGVSLFS